MGAVAVCLFSSVAVAASLGKSKAERYHETIFELSVDENVAEPEVPKKQVPAVVGYMKKVAGSFVQHKELGLTVEMARGGQVAVVSLPSDALFAPNDTVLSPSAAELLKPFAKHLTVKDMFKFLVVVHSDDTGTEEYLNSLTEARAEAVAAMWAADPQSASDAVVPYGFGAAEPLVANNSRTNRAKNRRVEIYMIPGPEMIARAKSGKLH